MGLFDNVAFWVTDAGDRVAEAARQVEQEAGYRSVASAPGAGFSLDRDQANRMLAKCRTIREDLLAIQQNAVSLAQVKPPARDPASLEYQGNITVQGDGKPAVLAVGADHVQVEINYLDSLIDRIEQALGIYHKSDQEQAHAVGQAAPGDTHSVANGGGYTG